MSRTLKWFPRQGPIHRRDPDLKHRREGEAAPALIERDNPDASDDWKGLAIKIMKDNGIVQTDDTYSLGIGAPGGAHWPHYCRSMMEGRVLQAGVDTANACSLELVGKA